MRDHDVTAMRYPSNMSEVIKQKHFLREWREHRGLSLRKLADRMESEPGVPLYSHAQIGRFETGENNYTQDFLEALADALRCTPGDLLSVDPRKDGEVVDLIREMKKRGLDILLQERDLDMITNIIRELPKSA